MFALLFEVYRRHSSKLTEVVYARNEILMGLHGRATQPIDILRFARPLGRKFALCHLRGTCPSTRGSAAGFIDPSSRSSELIVSRENAEETSKDEERISNAESKG